MDFSLEKLKSKNVFVAIIFALTIFIKCVLFHYFCFGYVAVSSLWSAPGTFFDFYITKALFAVFIASFVFVSKKNIWTIFMSFIIDIWIIANYIYFRSNGLFLSLDMIFIADNLSGFWSSIFAYLNWKVFAFLMISVLYSFFLLYKRVTCERSLVKFFSCLGVTIIMYGTDVLLYDGNIFGHAHYRVRYVKTMAEGKSCATFSNYVESSSILHLFPTMLIFHVERSVYLKEANKNIVFSSREKELISNLIKEGKDDITPTTNLCLILVESLESWPMFISDENGTEILPNLNRLSQQEHILFCNMVKSQTKFGSSGDGQMILNSGMLPILSGAACMLYNNQPYPNFAGLYSNSICISPAGNNVWCQAEMNRCYEYSKYVFPERDVVSNDEYVLKRGYEQLSVEPFVEQIITVSSHVPFEGVPETLNLHEEMPSKLRKYLNCIHYADSCIGDFLRKIEKDSLLQNTTIVITGDHTIFKSSMLQDFRPFAEKYDFPIPADMSYCPLIVYSPSINGRVEINELCYQMDIFPTILHCIGADDYFWKGFGENLLDSVARNKRSLTEDEAYMLSDKMIRSDYFRQYEKKQ